MGNANSQADFSVKYYYMYCKLKVIIETKNKKVIENPLRVDKTIKRCIQIFAQLFEKFLHSFSCFQST